MDLRVIDVTGIVYYVVAEQITNPIGHNVKGDGRLEKWMPTVAFNLVFVRKRR